MVGSDEVAQLVVDERALGDEHNGAVTVQLRQPVRRAEVVAGGQDRTDEADDFFLGEIRSDALAVWDGLQKLEHVAITLGGHANPQQVFESLNSTGTPLRNYELIHNYVLMGLTWEQQIEIEDSFWIPIEQNTGDALDNFLRDYLILRTGRDSQFIGERGVYNVFKKEFPAPKFESLTKDAVEWNHYSEVYCILLDPAREVDEEVRRQLRYITTFGTAMYPLLLRVYRDYQLATIGRTELLAILEQLQTLYLRKMVVGASRDHLSAQLCRKLRQYGYPIRAVTRSAPSDERIRESLKHRPLPHAGYVLDRIDQPGDLGELQIEHIFPQAPGPLWSPDGIRHWCDFSELERAKYREILSTIGNLALLEPCLNAGASNLPFPDKKPYYECSKVPAIHDLVGIAAWDLPSIAERTQTMTERFLEIWNRRGPDPDPDPDHLVPILDAEQKFGFYKGWKTEFEYAVFQGEIWEIRNVRTLFTRVFKRLWETKRPEVLEYSEAHGGPIFATEAWKSQWEILPGSPGSHYLFVGLFPHWLLVGIQNVLDQFDMADDLFVKYSSDED